LLGDLGLCQYVESTLDSLHPPLLYETTQIVAWDAQGRQIRWAEYPNLADQSQQRFSMGEY
jgi:hypothetical protein